MEFRQQTAIMSDGSQLYYEVYGTGFPVVLLHGNGGNGKFFSKQIPFLSRYFQLVIIDSRGHGRSANYAETLSFSLMARDIFEILEQEKIAQADFIGFSDGANLAMVFAVNYPQKVHRLVLNAGNLNFAGLRKISQWTSYLIVAVSHVLALFGSRLKRLKTASDLLLKDTGLRPDDLQTIQAPTLIIVGAHDVIKKSHSRNLAHWIPNSQFIEVPKVGHQLARQAPAAFNQLILAFLQDRRSSWKK
ncbi:alpha/beta fold hydrolase [Enterococcus sp. LJL120]